MSCLLMTYEIYFNEQNYINFDVQFLILFSFWLIICCSWKFYIFQTCKGIHIFFRNLAVHGFKLISVTYLNLCVYVSIEVGVTFYVFVFVFCTGYPVILTAHYFSTIYFIAQGILPTLLGLCLPGGKSSLPWWCTVFYSAPHPPSPCGGSFSAVALTALQDHPGSLPPPLQWAPAGSAQHNKFSIYFIGKAKSNSNLTVWCYFECNCCGNCIFYRS